MRRHFRMMCYTVNDLIIDLVSSLSQPCPLISTKANKSIMASSYIQSVSFLVIGLHVLSMEELDDVMAKESTVTTSLWTMPGNKHLIRLSRMTFSLQSVSVFSLAVIIVSP